MRRRATVPEPTRAGTGSSPSRKRTFLARATHSTRPEQAFACDRVTNRRSTGRLQHAGRWPAPGPGARRMRCSAGWSEYGRHPRGGAPTGRTSPARSTGSRAAARTGLGVPRRSRHAPRYPAGAAAGAHGSPPGRSNRDGTRSPVRPHRSAVRATAPSRTGGRACHRLRPASPPRAAPPPAPASASTPPSPAGRADAAHRPIRAEPAEPTSRPPARGSEPSGQSGQSRTGRARTTTHRARPLPPEAISARRDSAARHRRSGIVPVSPVRWLVLDA